MVRRYAFPFLWLAGVLGAGWSLAQGRHTFDLESALPLLLVMFACTAALIQWLAGPSLPPTAAAQSAGRGKLLLAILATGAVLVLLRELLGRPLLFGFPIAALLVLIWLRPAVTARRVVYALILATVAAVAGLGVGHITFVSLPVWAVLQAPLVFFCLLAGWSMQDKTELWRAGLGRSRVLDGDLGRALRASVAGAVIALPWAMLNVVMGGSDGDTWMHSWWQTLAALQPAIAEEAWGRVFLVPLLLLVLRRVARPDSALTAAIVLAAYWFAYLHTPGGVASLFSTLLIGTLFSLPIYYIWLRRDLETAMGFHFMTDFVRFLAGYVLTQGLV
jgi:hypothetical protein